MASPETLYFQLYDKEENVVDAKSTKPCLLKSVEPGTKDAIEIPLMELRDTLESHRWGMTLEDTIECGLTIPSRYDIVQVFGENVAIHGKSKMHALASKWETFQEKTDVKIVLGPLVIFADPGIREQYKEESWALSPELFKADPDSVYYWEHNDLEGPASQDMETSMWFSYFADEESEWILGDKQVVFFYMPE